MEKDYPLAIALEKAGYSILSFKGILQSIYDTEKGELVKSPVMCLKVTPAKGTKALFIDRKKD